MKYYKLTGKKKGMIFVSYAANTCLSYAIEDFCSMHNVTILNAVKVNRDCYIGNAGLN